MIIHCPLSAGDIFMVELSHSVLGPLKDIDDIINEFAMEQVLFLLG